MSRDVSAFLRRKRMLSRVTGLLIKPTTPRFAFLRVVELVITRDNDEFYKWENLAHHLCQIDPVDIGDFYVRQYQIGIDGYNAVIRIDSCLVFGNNLKIAPGLRYYILVL